MNIGDFCVEDYKNLKKIIIIVLKEFCLLLCICLYVYGMWVCVYLYDCVFFSFNFLSKKCLYVFCLICNIYK